MDEEALRQFPAWREGLKRFHAAGFKAGDTIPHQWFYDAFEINRPSDETPFAAAERAKLSYVAAFERLRTELLEAHQIGLASVAGVGYRIVPPPEQTSWAEKECIADLRSALSKGAGRLANVNLTDLTPQQRCENADALARLSFLAGSLKRVKKREPLTRLLGEQ